MAENPFLQGVQAVLQREEADRKKKVELDAHIKFKWGAEKSYIESVLIANIPIKQFSFDDKNLRPFKISVHDAYLSVIFGSSNYDYYNRADGKLGRLIGVDYRKYREARITESIVAGNSVYEIRIFGGYYVKWSDGYGRDEGKIFALALPDKTVALNALLEACGRCYAELEGKW